MQTKTTRTKTKGYIHNHHCIMRVTYQDMTHNRTIRTTYITENSKNGNSRGCNEYIIHDKMACAQQKDLP